MPFPFNVTRRVHHRKYFLPHMDTNGDDHNRIAGCIHCQWMRRMDTRSPMSYDESRISWWWWPLSPIGQTTTTSNVFHITWPTLTYIHLAQLMAHITIGTVIPLQGHCHTYTYTITTTRCAWRLNAMRKKGIKYMNTLTHTHTHLYIYEDGGEDENKSNDRKNHEHIYKVMDLD